MKEFFINAAWTIKDDRFGWKFKLCNIIMNDRLRLNIAATHVWLDNLSNSPVVKDNAFFIKKLNDCKNDIHNITTW